MKKAAPTVLMVVLLSCSGEKKQMDMPPSQSEIKLYTLTNKNGLKMTVTNFGGKVVSQWVPDKDGNLGDIVLGYDSLQQYLNGNAYFGALIGRYGNRIGRGKFKLDGKEFQLATNNGVNALHGGPGGFNNVFWKVKPKKVEGFDALELSYSSPDGEEGYPGNLEVKVTYVLNDNNEFVIDYEAATDKTTIVNLTHHSFYNLAGEGAGDILGHRFEIFADRFTPVDTGLIPTGELRNVENTPFDFRNSHSAGERIDGEDEQLKFGRGYDHNWVLNKNGNELSLAARVTEPVSGRVMEMWTTEPGMQFYSGNFLDGSNLGKGGKQYGFRSAFCFEAQHFPDSPNKSNFPSTLLKPGEKYKQRTIYRFSVMM